MTVASERELVFANGVKRRLPRVAVGLIAGLGLLLGLLALAGRGSNPPLVVTVVSEGAGVQVKVENPSPWPVTFFFVSDGNGEWNPMPDGLFRTITLDEKVWTKEYSGPEKSGRYCVKVGYWHPPSPSQRFLQKVAGRLGMNRLWSRPPIYVESNEFEFQRGAIAGFREQPQLADAFSGAFIHQAEQDELREAFSGFASMENGPSPVPAFPQPLHIIFPGQADLPYLISCLSDPSAHVREQAAAALATFSLTASEAIPALTHVAEKDPDETVRQRAKEALYNIRGYDPGFIEAPIDLRRR